VSTTTEGRDQVDDVDALDPARGQAGQTKAGEISTNSSRRMCGAQPPFGGREDEPHDAESPWLG